MADKFLGVCLFAVTTSVFLCYTLVVVFYPLVGELPEWTLWLPTTLLTVVSSLLLLFISLLYL